jgi:hypothetical protein
VSSGSKSGESSSSSSSGRSSAEWDEFNAEDAWRPTVTQCGFTNMIGAAEPLSRKKVAYKVGPERYSSDGRERDYGSVDASCKAAFRFNLRDLRMLFAAMHFPDEIDTGEETVPSEEAFLILLKRLAYPMRPYQSDIQKFWPVAQILTNCHTCFYSSQDKPLF